MDFSRVVWVELFRVEVGGLRHKAALGAEQEDRAVSAVSAGQVVAGGIGNQMLNPQIQVAAQRKLKALLQGEWSYARERRCALAGREEGGATRQPRQDSNAHVGGLW